MLKYICYAVMHLFLFFMLISWRVCHGYVWMVFLLTSAASKPWDLWESLSTFSHSIIMYYSLLHIIIMSHSCAQFYLFLSILSHSLAFHGFSWLFMAFHGFSWLFMAFHGFSWLFMAFHGFSWLSPMHFPGPLLSISCVAPNLGFEHRICAGKTR